MKKLFLLMFSLLFFSACQRSLSENGKLRPFEQTSFFADHSSARPWPEGVVPRKEKVEKEPTPTLESLRRGQQQFQIYCQVCHGIDGRGNGMAVQRGFPQPVNLLEDQMLNAPTELFYETITVGYGRMFAYGNRLTSSDRWAIAQYIRVLQLQQHFPAQELTKEDLKNFGDGQ